MGTNKIRPVLPGGPGVHDQVKFRRRLAGGQTRPDSESCREPPGRRTPGLVLFHGAGGDRDHDLFIALEERLPFPVDRVNFPYRKKAIAAGRTRRPPDRMPKLVEAVNEAVAESASAWDLEPAEIVVGGRSMGGRAASMAVAEGLPAAGVVLLSYPLHPPGKPDRLRVDHLADVRCPVLLVQGRRDPFGTPEEFARQLPSLAGPLTEVWIDGGHDPTRTVPSIELVVGCVEGWMNGLT